MSARIASSLACGIAALLCAPAVAGATPTLTQSCPFFCEVIVTDDGAAENDDIEILTKPGNSDHIRFIGRNASSGAWGIGPGVSCNAPVTSDGVTTIDCNEPWVGVVLNLAGGDDRVFFNHLIPLGGRVAFSGGPGNDTFSQADGLTTPAILDGGAGDDSLFSGAGIDDLKGGTENDFLGAAGGEDTLDGGGGRDSLDGGAGGDELNGGASSDSLFGGAGTDNLVGGDGRDLLTPGTEKDEVAGNEGFDLAIYGDRGAASPVNVTLDGLDNDGQEGEGDNIHTDVEDVRGGAGNDVIVGNDQDNVLDGGAGVDDITGGGGFDTFLGGGGADTLRARDGTRESIDCGGDTDSAIGDEIDELVDCESADLSSDLVADFDGDGFVKPADCNDRNAAIRPNATETPDNGVDENCDGSDAVNLDRDGDGIPRPADCDDTNRAVRPGATEVRGNAVDEDCNSIAEPYPSILSPVRNRFTAFRTFSKVDRLQVRDVPKGATVRVRCRGRGCPSKGFKRTVKKRTKLLNVRSRFAGRRLRVGARLEVRITKPNTIGRVVRFTMRRLALPSIETLCMPPGKKRPEEC